MSKYSIRQFTWLNIAALFAVAATHNPARADEGMWPFHNPPVAEVAKKYSVNLTAGWLEDLRLSSARFGSSSSFVSADGLILTNHHVAVSCVQRLSSAADDLVRNGFLARSSAEERVCPGAEVTMLVGFDEVTAQLADAKSDAGKRQTMIAAIEKKCADETKLRCQVVTLYRGGQYWLYRYQVWQEVRLVWVPEARLGAFGGDADNFVFPRFSLDAAFLRAYENGKPVKPSHFLKLAKDGVKDGEVVFSAGNPGSTDRALTVAELNYLRLQGYPIRVTNTESAHRAMVKFGKIDAESQRRADDPLRGIENGLKVVRGETKALAVDRLHQRKRADEDELREKAKALVASGAFRFANGNDPWGAIEAATKRQHQNAFEMTGTNYPQGTLLAAANNAVAVVMESRLPTGERLRGFRDSALPQLRRALTSPRVWYRDLEEARLTQKIEEAMAYLGQSHPFVAGLLQGATPNAAAKRIIGNSKFDDVAVRRALLSDGEKALRESTDSLVMLVRDLYPLWRLVREREQREVDAVKEAAHDDIARLKFQLHGQSLVPDATGTLRLGVGRVAGFDRDGVLSPWVTTFHGLFERNLAFGNQPPFELPPRWLAAKSKLNLDTPYNFVSTLDIIGGSSGSPAVNARGELVGVLFDGNLDGFGNRFQYQDRNARAVAVDMRAVVEALDKVYEAKELVRELTAHWAKQ